MDVIAHVLHCMYQSLGRENNVLFKEMQVLNILYLIIALLWLERWPRILQVL